ncbi:unnamed protein product, partial [marine sediment metagenome]
MSLISTIFHKFSKGKEKQENIITDEMRAKALETRRLNAQVIALERRKDVQDKLEILEQAITGKKKGSDVEDMFMKLLMAKILTPQQSQQSGLFSGSTPLPTQPQQQRSLNDNQINEAVKVIKKKLPTEAKKFITQVSDADLIE